MDRVSAGAFPVIGLSMPSMCGRFCGESTFGRCQRVAFLAILHDPARIGELCAEGVGFRPVFREAGLPAGFRESLDRFRDIRRVMGGFLRES